MVGGLSWLYRYGRGAKYYLDMVGGKGDFLGMVGDKGDLIGRAERENYK